MPVSQILNKFISNTNHRIYNKDLFENAFLEFIKNKYLSIKLDDVIKDYRLGLIRHAAYTCVESYIKYSKFLIDKEIIDPEFVIDSRWRCNMHFLRNFDVYTIFYKS